MYEEQDRKSGIFGVLGRVACTKAYIGTSDLHAEHGLLAERS